MSKYHPIDVRYKGPSTSYRGSASRKTSANAPRDTHRAAATPPPTKPVATPWDPKAQHAREFVRRIIENTPERRRPRMLWSVLGNIYRKVRSANLIIVIIFIMIGLFSNPGILFEWLGLGATQMISLP